MEDTRKWIFRTTETVHTIIVSAYLSQPYIVSDNLQTTRGSVSLVMHSPGVQAFIIGMLF
jgi:hypothetical protein